MNTTPREIWYWLTAEAWETARLIRATPLDMPVSSWLHVGVATTLWLRVLMFGLVLTFHVLAEPLAAVSAFGARRVAAGRAGFWQSVMLGFISAWLVGFALISLGGAAVAGALFWPVGLVSGIAWFIWGRRGVIRRAGRWYGARKNRRD